MTSTCSIYNYFVWKTFFPKITR